jgi:hypothetical protein
MVANRRKAFLPETLKMGQTSVLETLVTHQKLTPGYNPKTFKQQEEGCLITLENAFLLGIYEYIVNPYDLRQVILF